MRSLNEALSAVSALNGSPTDRGPLVVSIASEDEPPEQMVVQLQALQQQVAQLMAQTAHQARILAQTQMASQQMPGINQFHPAFLGNQYTSPIYNKLSSPITTPLASFHTPLSDASDFSLFSGSSPFIRQNMQF